MSRTFQVWRDWCSREEDGVSIDAYDVRSAATRRAEEDHARRSGWEWSWPVTYHVQETSSYGAEGAVYKVEVQRHTVPEFEAGKPELVGG